MFTWFTLLFNLPLIFGQIKISDENTEPLNVTGIRFSFRVRGNTDQLNGHFSVEHKDCSNRYCGQKVYSPPISDGNQIRIGTELSPCSDHFGLKIKAGKFDFAGGGVVVFRRDWKALVCNKTQIRNPFEETYSSVRTQTSNDTTVSSTDSTVNVHYDKITTISIAKKSENNTKEIKHKIKDNATQNIVAKNNDKQIILVAFIASSITLVATLAVVFFVLFARRLWSKRTRAEVEKNPDYGFYYGSVLIFIWTRSIRFKIQNLFISFFSPDGERIDNGVVEMVDQNNYYENS